jgi:hypothetical protein
VDALTGRYDIPPTNLRKYGLQPDPGVLRSSVPNSTYKPMLDAGHWALNPNGPYKGFAGNLKSSEIQIKTPEGASVFDQHLDYGWQFPNWWR